MCCWLAVPNLLNYSGVELIKLSIRVKQLPCARSWVAAPALGRRRCSGAPGSGSVKGRTSRVGLKGLWAVGIPRSSALWCLLGTTNRGAAGAANRGSQSFPQTQCSVLLNLSSECACLSGGPADSKVCSRALVELSVKAGCDQHRHLWVSSSVSVCEANDHHQV